MKINLLAERCSELGEIGLFIEGSENIEYLFACYNGRLLAHDVMEHHPYPDGTIADEIKALGAVQYVRGDFEEIRLNYDLDGLYEDYENRDEVLPELPDIECDERELFEEYVKASNLPERLTLNLLCQGYNEAKARYPYRLGAYTQYYNIVKAFDKLDTFEVGQRFVLNIKNEDEVTIC